MGYSSKLHLQHHWWLAPCLASCDGNALRVVWEPRPIFLEATMVYFLVLGVELPSLIQVLLIVPTWPQRPQDSLLLW
jgi:hypothetical protein